MSEERRVALSALLVLFMALGLVGVTPQTGTAVEPAPATEANAAGNTSGELTGISPDGDSVSDGLLGTSDGTVSSDTVDPKAGWVLDPGRDDGLKVYIPATAAERIKELGQDWNDLFQKLKFDDLLILHGEADKVRVSVGAPEFDAETFLNQLKGFVSDFQAAKSAGDPTAMEKAFNDLCAAYPGTDPDGPPDMDPAIYDDMKKALDKCKAEHCGDFGADVVVPMPTYYTSPYGPRNFMGGTFHHGIDLPVESGTSLKSLGSGVVTGSGWEDIGGFFITIQYDNGYSSTYCHLDHSVAAEGDRVTAGQEVAISDNTGGRTSGPHLHLGMRDANGEWVDPQTVPGLNLPKQEG